MHGCLLAEVGLGRLTRGLAACVIDRVCLGTLRVAALQLDGHVANVVADRHQTPKLPLQRQPRPLRMSRTPTILPKMRRRPLRKHRRPRQLKRR